MSPVAWLVVAFLILVNAVYVAAEFAAVSVKRSRVRKLAEEGDRSARLLLAEIDDPRRLDRWVAVSQIGITASSLVLGAYGQAAIAPSLGPPLGAALGLEGAAAAATAAIVVLIVLTAAQMVLGELVPKSLALQFSTRMALLSVHPMRASGWLFAGFIHVLNGSGLAILRWFGAGDSGHRHVHSPEEIEMLIVESSDGGLLEPEESRRLRRALGLRLRRAEQLMVPRGEIVAIDADAPLDASLERLLESRFTRLPVYRGELDRILGVVHVKDLLARAAAGTLAGIEELLRPAVFVPAAVRADRLLIVLRERRAQMAIVVDEHGGVDGLVSLSDILREVLGRTAEEHGGGGREPERLADGRVRLPGRLPLDRAARWTGATWSGHSGTVAGVVLERLGRVPRVGESFDLDGATVVVEAMAGNAIASLLVTPAPEESADG